MDGARLGVVVHGSLSKGLELKLDAEPRIDRFEAKAGFTIARDYYALSPGADADATGIAPDRVDGRDVPRPWRLLANRDRTKLEHI